jgi:hypothetical protein
MGFSNYIFSPLNALSDKADEIISEARKTIEAGIAAGKYSPAVVDQYRILLKNLEEKVPSCEVIGFPGFLFGPSKSRTSSRTGIHCNHLRQNFLNLERNTTPFVPD